MDETPKPLAIVAAFIAAFVGAGLWAVVAVVSGWELGILAWAVGLLVGAAAFIAGGEGALSGIVCAFLTVLAIFGGKYMAINHEIGKVRAEFDSSSLTEADYQVFLIDAAAFAAVERDEDHAAYMVQHEFTESKVAHLVSQTEIDEFREFTAPTLLEAANDPPSYEEWKDENRAYFDLILQTELNTTSLIVENLGILDLVFGILGIVSAFRVGSRGFETSSA